MISAISDAERVWVPSVVVGASITRRMSVLGQRPDSEIRGLVQNRVVNVRCVRSRYILSDCSEYDWGSPAIIDLVRSMRLYLRNEEVL